MNVTERQVGGALGLTNPNAAQSQDLKAITNDLNTGAPAKQLEGDVIKLSKDDPKLLGGGSSGAGKPGGGTGGPSNDDAIKALIAMLMQLLQQQGSSGQGQGTGGGSGQPVTQGV
jgi:ribosomal protein S2